MFELPLLNQLQLFQKRAGDECLSDDLQDPHETL